MIELMQARYRARHLRDILRRERDLLRRGQYQELAEIENLSGKAMSDLLNIRQDVAKKIADDIRSIQAEAARNKVLFGAALSGVDAARAQISEMTAQTGKLGVYTSAGDRVELPARPSGKTRRY